MYVIEHALLNIGKNKGRNVLLASIVFAIITTTVVALAIYNTASASIAETRTALQCAVRIVPQRQAVGAGGAGVSGGNAGAAGGANASSGDVNSSDGDLNASGSGAGASGSGAGASPLSYEEYLRFAESEYLDGADIKENGGTRPSAGAAQVDAVYYLKRPELLAAFETELRSLGLPDEYIVKTDEANLERMAGSIESLKGLSLTFLLIVMGLGAIIMVLLSVIAIRERKYEIGVLRAMGMKKNKVALGLWAETIAVTCICFVLGMGAGTLLSQPVSNAIMAGQARSADAGSTSLADRLNPVSAEVAEKIDVSVDGITALEIFGISILLASISGVISVSRITKSEPIKILMERN